jgi:hypothetical protein
MRKQKSFAVVIFAALILACLQTAALGQTANDDKLANVTGGGSSIRWDVVVSNSGGSLTVSAPDGRVFTREFKAGVSPEISLSDRQLEKLPDGTYGYELRLRPVLSAGEREALKAARGKDDDPEAERAARKRPVLPVLVQSGAFSILNGSVVVGGASEGQRSNAKSTQSQQSPGVVSGNTVTRLRNHRLSLFSMPDIIHADDVIIQGSLCVGLDCVNGESFSFDTIRLKENNTRISFNDTSVSTFPTNDWTIRANSSANGGASFLAFVDRGTSESGDETGTIVFEVDAGAPANSLKVSSTGRVGLRTATPVLDVHANTSDTPAIRLEQNSSGGFTAQTWDIAGNEANFFVRDVTSGSRLPFRIRPGAPTSSIDISASGNVGIGTASPGNLIGGLSLGGTILQVRNDSSNAQFLLSSSGGVPDIKLETSNATATKRVFESLYDGANNLAKWRFANEATGAITQDNVLVLKNDGKVGVGTAAPDQVFSVNGDASKTGGNTWLAFSDERLKTIKGRFTPGLKAVMQLQPIRYEYLKNNALGLKSEGEHVGFGAQTLQKIIPEAVTKNADGYLMINSDPIMWTMLNAIKEQQKEIAELKAQVQRLRAASHRRRK